MKEKVLYGKASGSKGIIHLYTEKSNRIMSFVRFIILVVFSPIWLPFYVLIFVGAWSEILVDKSDDLLDKLLQKIIPRNL